MNKALKSELYFVEYGREEKAFQAKQRLRQKRKKVHGMFWGPVSQPVQFKHGGA